MTPQKSPGKILLASGGLAVLLLAGIGCAKKEVPVSTTPMQDLHIDTPPAPTIPDCMENGLDVQCNGLWINPPENLTDEQRDALEQAIAATGAEVRRTEAVSWNLTLSATGSEEFQAWKAALASLHSGFVYFDGSKLSLVPIQPDITMHERTLATQQAGYVGSAAYGYDGEELVFVPKDTLTAPQKDAVEQAFIAGGAKPQRHGPAESWSIYFTPTDSEGLHQWFDKISAVPNVGHVQYLEILRPA